MTAVSQAGAARLTVPVSADEPALPRCRACDSELRKSFADLGCSPLANALVEPRDAKRGEKIFPLHAYVCESCYLVQLDEFETPENIFSHYSYFSSFSDSFLRHAEQYANEMQQRFNLGPGSLVVEVGSNDGYLLQYFVRRGTPVLGIDPAANVAATAIERGVPTEVAFFGTETARRLAASGVRPNLMAANNVLAHVPRLRDFVQGFRILLAPDGVATFEFPHLLRLIEQNQFDTIYHEHFCYFSLTAVDAVFAGEGLRIFDVERVSTHGGSLRIFVCHHDADKPTTARTAALLDEEALAGLRTMQAYEDFGERARETKRRLLDFLIQAKREGKSIAAYGAAAKAVTLFHYCGVGRDFVDYIVDRSRHKQGRLLPGSHIPILAPERIAETKPDYLLVVPWNLKAEISEQMAHIREWGGRLVTAIPEVSIDPC